MLIIFFNFLLGLFIVVTIIRIIVIIVSKINSQFIGIICGIIKYGT